jgi:hypothetical protein
VYDQGGISASRTCLLLGDGSGQFNPLSTAKSGINVTGEVRSLQIIEIKEEPILLIGANNRPLATYRIKSMAEAL